MGIDESIKFFGMVFRNERLVMTHTCTYSEGKIVTDFTVHTLDSAPEGSKAVLNAAKKRYGFVPNLMGVLAEAPAAVQAYAMLSDTFASGSLNPVEQQVVALAVSHVNGCTYCMGAHSGVAKLAGLPDAEIEALRDGRPLNDPGLEGLRRFTRILVEKRGRASPEDVAEFLGAGYTKAQVLEVIVGVAFKTLSNYANHLVDTPLDRQFAAFAWEPTTAAAA